MVSDKFSTNVILFYSYKFFATDWYWSKKLADSPKLRKISKTLSIVRLEDWTYLYGNVSSWAKFPKQCNGIAASCFQNGVFTLLDGIVTYYGIYRCKLRLASFASTIYFKMQFCLSCQPLPYTNWTGLDDTLTFWQDSLANLIKLDSSQNSYWVTE